MNDNLSKIIANENLQDYILGMKEFQTTRPDVYYSRWFNVKTYYRSLSSNNPQKRYIEGNILNLIESDDPERKRIGILVGRVIGLPVLRKILSRLITEENFDSLPIRTRDEVCFSATLLQAKEVEVFLVRYFFVQNRLREFVFCSNTPPYMNEIKEDDLWRVEAIGKFYDSSSEKVQKTILSDIESSLKDSRNFRLAVDTYLVRTNKNTSFLNDVRRIFNATSE